MGSRDGGISNGLAIGRLAPEALEWLATLAVIVFLSWQSAPFRDLDFTRGTGDRYRQAVELSAPILPLAAQTGRVVDLCTRLGGWLPAAERESAAGRTGVCHSDSRYPIPSVAAHALDPAELEGLARTYDALVQSLELPVKARLSRLTEFENRAREGLAETDVQGAIEDLAGETRLY